MSISLRYSVLAMPSTEFFVFLTLGATMGIFLSADAARQLSLYPFTLGALESRGSHHDTPEKRIR